MEVSVTLAAAVFIGAALGFLSSYLYLKKRQETEVIHVL